MSDARSINWTGKSGREYTHFIYSIDQTFKDVPGNYIFAKETSPHKWSPCYIGQTGSLRDRMDGHEKEACARRHGATHIHVHVNSSAEDARRAQERDLIEQWQPPCNKQLTVENVASLM